MFRRVAAIWLLGLTASSAAQADDSNVPCDVAYAASVSEIYPTSDLLPENLLRFYVYFNRPMQPNSVLPEIALTDERGVEIEGVFLTNRYDLWSADRTRMTLLLNPGRVKTGLQASKRLGRAIKKGKTYTLTIGAEAKDERGCSMEIAHTKRFVVTASDITAPDPHHWKVEQPVAGSKNLLKVSLHDTYDHVSLAYRIRVHTHAGVSVPGRISVAAYESEWRFAPTSPWQDGEYVLRVAPVLEDLAGNRPTGLFDDPTGNSRRRQADATPIHIPFSISTNSKGSAKDD